MVSQNKIKGLDFETIEDYYNYVIESKINGQHKQCNDLIIEMSKQQKIDFIRHANQFTETEDILWCINETLKEM